MHCEQNMWKHLVMMTSFWRLLQMEQRSSCRIPASSPELSPVPPPTLSSPFRTRSNRAASAYTAKPKLYQSTASQRKIFDGLINSQPVQKVLNVVLRGSSTAISFAHLQFCLFRVMTSPRRLLTTILSLTLRPRKKIQIPRLSFLSASHQHAYSSLAPVYPFSAATDPKTATPQDDNDPHQGRLQARVKISKVTGATNPYEPPHRHLP